MGAFAPLPRVRSRRLLRRLAQPARHEALPQDEAPRDAQLRAGRGLGILLCRPAHVRARAATALVGPTRMATQSGGGLVDTDDVSLNGFAVLAARQYEMTIVGLCALQIVDHQVA